MAARKPAALRAVGADEKPPPTRRPRTKTIVQAAAGGDPRELLVALRSRIAKAVQDPNTPARDLAALSRRLLEVAREIEAIDSRDGEDEIGEAASTPDAAFDPEAL